MGIEKMHQQRQKTMHPSQQKIILQKSFKQASEWMPCNATKTGLKKALESQESFPDEVHVDLEFKKQLACCKFWHLLGTSGSEGWPSSTRPGVVKNTQSSSHISSRIKEESWEKIGKVSSCPLSVFPCCNTNLPKTLIARLWPHLPHI